jgi:hypothetical protein
MHFGGGHVIRPTSKKQRPNRPKEGPITTFGYKYMELGFASPPQTNR